MRDTPDVKSIESAATASPVAGADERRARLREVAALFLRLGFTAFGGPAAHVAMMEDEVVRRRRWLDRQHFLDLVAALNFIPGPNSTELAIHLGLIRAGFGGLVVAGVCFILPAVLIILPLAWAYVTYGSVPAARGALEGIGAAVVSIIAIAFWRFARTGVVDSFTAVVATLTVPAWFALRAHHAPHPELIILAAAAVLGAVRALSARGGVTMTAIPAVLFFFVGPQAAVPGPGSVSSVRSEPISLLKIGWYFLQVGATLFGSGYVLVSYLQSGLVERGWLTSGQLLDAVAVGQFSPGPLLTTATFIGYLLGHQVSGGAGGAIAGALVATVAIFLPSFVLVALFAPLLGRLRRNALARGALDAMNAAVAVLIAIAGASLAVNALDNVPSWLVAGAAGTALAVWNVNATWVVLACGLAGYLVL